MSHIWQKGRGNYVSLAAALLQGFMLARTRLMRVLDVSRLCPRRFPHTFKMHPVPYGMLVCRSTHPTHRFERW